MDGEMVALTDLAGGRLFIGDVLDGLSRLPDESVHCCVTSPPYWNLRDYGVKGQLGLEATPEEYVANMVAVFREVRRVLRSDGTLWLNIGDSYASIAGGYSDTGSRGASAVICAKTQAAVRKGVHRTPPVGLKSKDLCGIPWRTALGLQSDGWYLRQDIIWAKPNPMPESVTDRCTKSHEYVFLMSKSPKYHFSATAIAEPLTRPEEANRKTPAVFGGRDKFTEAQKQSRLHSGNAYVGTSTGTRNKRSVWRVSTRSYKGAHFAVFPPRLIEPCILAGCPEGGTVLDPFMGSGTTAQVAVEHRRKWVGCELNPKNEALIRERLKKVQPCLV